MLVCSCFSWLLGPVLCGGCLLWLVGPSVGMAGYRARESWSVPPCLWEVLGHEGVWASGKQGQFCHG